MSGTSESQDYNMRLAYIALLCGGIIGALSFGIRSGFGVFLPPITAELGVGREVFAFSLALQNLIWGATQPFAGAIADRYGPFRAICGGAVVYAAGTVLIAFSATPSMLHLSAGMLVGAGLAGTSFGIILGAVGQLFPPERRSWALGVTGASGSLGQFLLVPVAGSLVASFGWQDAALFMGLGSLVMVPLAIAFWPLKGTKANPLPSGQSLGQALREAFGYKSFWLLTSGFFVCGFQVAFIAVHLPAYVTDLGLPVTVGASALALVGLFNVIGSYSAGVLGGKFSKKYLLNLLYLGRAVVIVFLLLVPPSELVIYVFASAMGLLWLSTVPLTSGLVGQIFGMRYMSMLFGIVFFSHQIGSFLGVWLGGIVFDTTGSYDLIWYVSIGLALFAGFIHWPIREEAIERAPAPAE
jgi:MFS family permease